MIDAKIVNIKPSPIIDKISSGIKINVPFRKFVNPSEIFVREPSASVIMLIKSIIPSISGDISFSMELLI